MRPLPKEPDDEKKKKQKSTKGNLFPYFLHYYKVMHFNIISASKLYKPSDKLIISPPSNFEHTVHVGFDPITGEFTVSLFYFILLHNYSETVELLKSAREI